MNELGQRLRELQRISSDLQAKLATERKRYETKNKVWIETAVEYANYQAQRAAAQIFVRKYRAGGIETKTGRLLAAISAPKVSFKKTKDSREQVKIVLSFPPGLPGAKDAKKSKLKSVYVYGGALNSGAVHSPKVVRPYRDRINPRLDTYKVLPLVGRKLKKSLKRKAYGAKAKQRVEQYLERNKRLERRGVSQFAIKMRQSKYRDRGRVRTATKFDIASAGISITRAFNFFQLNGQEQNFLSALWKLAFNRVYERFSKLKIPA